LVLLGGQSRAASLPRGQRGTAPIGRVELPGGLESGIEHLGELHLAAGGGGAYGRLHDRLGPHVAVHLGVRGGAGARGGAGCRAGARAASSTPESCTRRPVSAARTAASTIAWLHTSLCTSESGVVPVRSAAQSSARDASSPQSPAPSGRRPMISWAPSGCAL